MNTTKATIIQKKKKKPTTKIGKRGKTVFVVLEKMKIIFYTF